MTAVRELESCDGFTVETPDGCLGWVEETWLDGEGHPAAVAVRTTDGRRALLRAEAVRAVDLDAQEVLVAPDVELLALEAPRVASGDGELTATWHAGSERLPPRLAGSRAAPDLPALGAARTVTARSERPLWHTLVFALGGLATLIAVEIGLAFGIAILVTGQAY